MFGKKKAPRPLPYDPAEKKPVLHVSICTGETAAGFLDLKTGHFHEELLISCSRDLEAFRQKYGITGELEKIY